MEKIIHQGKNVKYLREMQGIKQEALAYYLGEGWNLHEVILLEQKEIIEDYLLKQIAVILNIPVRTIKNFDEGKTINIIADAATDNVKLRFPVFYKQVNN